MSGHYDLVTIFEGLHDMSRPADALAAARGMLRQPGTVVIADEFTAPATDLERYHYGWSVVSCLPAAMGDPQTAATGAVMRPPRCAATPSRPVSATWRSSPSRPKPGASTSSLHDPCPTEAEF